MATVTKTSVPDSSTDVYFRAWGSDVSSALTTMGIVATSDTGQINWSTVTRPLTANASQGYEIRRFNDSLQATYPVFFKLEFGSGSNNAATGLWITIGTGSDGAGNITGTILARQQIAATQNSTTAGNSWRCSGDTNRFIIWPGMDWGLLNSGPIALMLSLERTHDSTGADTSEGLMMYAYDGGGALSGARSWFLRFAGNSFTYTRINVCLPPSGNGSNGANIYLYPFRTWAPYQTEGSKNLFMYCSGDISTLNAPTITPWWGGTCNIFASGINISTTSYNNGTGITAMRWD